RGVARKLAEKSRQGLRRKRELLREERRVRRGRRRRVAVGRERGHSGQRRRAGHSPPRVMYLSPFAVASRTRCPPLRGAPSAAAAASAVATGWRSISRIT